VTYFFVYFLSIFHVSKSQPKTKTKYIFPFCHINISYTFQGYKLRDLLIKWNWNWQSQERDVFKYFKRSWKVWPIYCNILYYFCKETTTILENYVTISWNIDINIHLHHKDKVYVIRENYFLNQMMYVSFNNTTTDVTYGVGNTNISGAPEFTTGFSGFCVMFCRSLSVILQLPALCVNAGFEWMNERMKKGVKIPKEVWISKSKNDRQRSTKHNTKPTKTGGELWGSRDISINCMA
jgi:hypothetical protein